MSFSKVWLVAAVVAALGAAACSENAAATAKCSSEKDSDKCGECCTKNGASGHKSINGSCGCLGGN